MHLFARRVAATLTSAVLGLAVVAPPALATHESPHVIDTIGGIGSVSDVAQNDTTDLLYVATTPTSFAVEDFEVTVIDRATHDVLDEIFIAESQVAGGDLAVSEVHNKVFAAHSQTDGIYVIDGATNAVVDRILLPVPSAPATWVTHMAVDDVRDRLYAVVLNSGVYEIDTATNDVVGKLDLLPDGELTTVTVDAVRDLLYAVNGDLDSVSVYDMAGNVPALLTTIPVGPQRLGFAAIDGANNRLYVSNEGDAADPAADSVTVIDTIVRTVVGTVTVGDRPWEIATNPVTGQAFVANFGDKTVSIIDASSLTVTHTVPTTGSAPPTDLAVDVDDDTVYVSANDVDIIADGPRDSDGDGLPDDDENADGTDPNDADSDDDGVDDGQEAADGTDPNDADSDDDGVDDGQEAADGTDPNDADSDDDGLDDGLEGDVGTDPLDGDTDDDGIPDGQDVEAVQGLVAGLPNNSFPAASATGKRSAITAVLDEVEALVADGDTAAAVRKLQNLRRHLDGCGVVADTNDWITDCTDQREVRDLVDVLIGNLA